MCSTATAEWSVTHVKLTPNQPQLDISSLFGQPFFKWIKDVEPELGFMCKWVEKSGQHRENYRHMKTEARIRPCSMRGGDKSRQSDRHKEKQTDTLRNRGRHIS